MRVFFFFGERFREPQQQLEFISAVKKDTQDGTDKCFIGRMWLKERSRDDLVFHDGGRGLSLSLGN